MWPKTKEDAKVLEGYYYVFVKLFSVVLMAGVILMTPQIILDVVRGEGRFGLAGLGFGVVFFAMTVAMRRWAVLAKRNLEVESKKFPEDRSRKEWQ